jgi:tRNA(Ile)-lysidine synthase
MSSLAARVLRTIRRHDLLPAGARVVVGVSGGSDSVALAHLLLALQSRGGFQVTGLAHVHHGLRGEAADRDEEFCRRLAAALSIPAYVERVDVRARAERERRSLEDAGRIVRAVVLARAAAALGGDRIAVGHTRDDQAETVLLKLFRGAGTRGLAAIHPRVGAIVRPLLDIGRDELRAWLGGRALPFVEDETNRDTAFRRNAVRHDLIPVISGQFGPGAIEALARHAEVAREDEAVLSSLVLPLVERLVRADESNIAVDCDGVGAVPPALGRRVALYALRMAGVSEPGFEHALTVLALARGEVQAAQLPGGVRGRRAGGQVLLTSASPEPPTGRFRYELTVPGSVWVPEAGQTVGAELAAAAAGALGRLATAGPSTAVIRGDELGPELFVRSWVSGDALRPLGLGGRKKLQDLFVDRKVPRAARPRLPLVVDPRDRIVWVPGHAIDEAYRVTSDTRAVVVLTVSESGGRE